MTERPDQGNGDSTQQLRAPAASGGDEPRTIFLDQAAAPEETSGVAQVSPLEIGRVLSGRFKLVDMIGEGGMSRVYHAIDLRRVEARSQDPFLAVKVLTLPLDDVVASMQVLEREAHKLQRLTHPNIVRVIDVDRDGPTVFMTMELLSGESLLAKLRQASASGRGLPREQAQLIIAGIASALEFAHRTGIVHGDLKPGNVFITHAGEVKVIDFGIARFLTRSKGADLPVVGDKWEAISAATPPYASPEMLEEMEPDPRDDIYALACIAHEVLTGQHPFARASSIEARDNGARLARSPAMTGDEFKAIAAGLQFDRTRRSASAPDFIDQFLGGRSGKARWMLAAGVAAAATASIAVYVSSSRQAGVAPGRLEPFTAGQVFRDCATCPLMKVVPAGKFVQGSLADASEQPPHPVTIPTAVAFAAHEVTIGEFKEFASDAQLLTQGCNVYDGEWRWREDAGWNSLADAGTTQHPVSCVSWDEATAYADWLSNKTGQTYRLPSASEWEYAAAAGAAAGTPLGADIESACQRANMADEAAAQRYPGWGVLGCNDRYSQRAPVGSFAANAFGLHDMIGNVFEWVQDCWSDSYAGSPANGAARTDGDCTQRELRGGSWFTSPAYLRASYRNKFAQGYRSSSVGFRIVRDVQP